MNRRIALFALAILASIVAGCSGKPTVGDADQVNRLQITGFIASINDAVQDPARFAKLWTTPPNDATLAGYKGYMFFASGEPTVSGTTAKCKIKLEKPPGTAAGEKEWEFEKAGDAWKIKSAPLS